MNVQSAIDSIVESTTGKLENELIEKISKLLLLQPYQVDCSECGEHLEEKERKRDTNGDLAIFVNPCPHCLKNP